MAAFTLSCSSTAVGTGPVGRATPPDGSLGKMEVTLGSSVVGPSSLEGAASGVVGAASLVVVVVSPGGGVWSVPHAPSPRTSARASSGALARSGREFLISRHLSFGSRVYDASTGGVVPSPTFPQGQCGPGSRKGADPLRRRPTCPRCRPVIPRHRAGLAPRPAHPEDVRNGEAVAAQAKNVTRITSPPNWCARAAPARQSPRTLLRGRQPYAEREERDGLSSPGRRGDGAAPRLPGVCRDRRVPRLALAVDDLAARPAGRLGIQHRPLRLRLSAHLCRGLGPEVSRSAGTAGQRLH